MMYDFTYALRQAYVDALQVVQYNAAPVPIVDDKLETTSPVYMRVTTMNVTQNNTKTYFAGECDVNIQVVSVQKSSVSKGILESISNDMMNALFPTMNTNGLIIGGFYKVSYAMLTNSVYSTAIQTADGFEISKTLTIKTRVIQ